MSSSSTRPRRSPYRLGRTLWSSRSRTPGGRRRPSPRRAGPASPVLTSSGSPTTRRRHSPPPRMRSCRWRRSGDERSGVRDVRRDGRRARPSRRERCRRDRCFARSQEGGRRRRPYPREPRSVASGSRGPSRLWSPDPCPGRCRGSRDGGTGRAPLPRGPAPRRRRDRCGRLAPRRDLHRATGLPGRPPRGHAVRRRAHCDDPRPRWPDHLDRPVRGEDDRTRRHRSPASCRATRPRSRIRQCRRCPPGIRSRTNRTGRRSGRRSSGRTGRRGRTSTPSSRTGAPPRSAGPTLGPSSSTNRPG